VKLKKLFPKKLLNTLMLFNIFQTGCGNNYNSGEYYSSPVSTSTAQEVDCNNSPNNTIVSIQFSSFIPASETIPINSVIMWINNDSSTQTVTSGAPNSPNGKFDFVLSPTFSKCLRFTESGFFEYYSRNLSLMTAQIIIQ
jgi:plastocyanin